TGVQFEWLPTGRGSMTPSGDALDSIAAVDALLVDDPQERRLLSAVRDAPAQSRVPLLELAEQLAQQRTGRRARRRRGEKRGATCSAACAPAPPAPSASAPPQRWSARTLRPPWTSCPARTRGTARARRSQ